MGYNNSTYTPKPLDESANEAILKHLAHGPLSSGTIAKLMREGGDKIAQRLYRMQRKGMVEQESHHGGKWALPGTFQRPKRDPDKSRLVPSRTAPDWRTTELHYDIDAHRRLAELTRR